MLKANEYIYWRSKDKLMVFNISAYNKRREIDDNSKNFN